MNNEREFGLSPYGSEIAPFHPACLQESGRTSNPAYGSARTLTNVRVMYNKYLKLGLNLSCYWTGILPVIRSGFLAITIRRPRRDQVGRSEGSPYFYSVSLNICRNCTRFSVICLPVDLPVSRFGLEVGKPFGFHNDPQPFDGVEIRRIGRRKDRFVLSPIR